jgi:hypothetical protein
MRDFTKHLSPASWFAVIAAFMYCSWPLAYFLNPAVGKHDLASQLEAPHQPYNWVFILMDVLTGCALIVAGILQHRANRLHNRRSSFAVWSYIAFGAMVAIAALVPLTCDPEQDACGSIWRNPHIIIHGFCSIASVLCLLVGLIVIAHGHYLRHASRRHIILLSSVLILWLLFGIGSLAEMALHISGNLLQYFFITVCSLSVIVLVYYIERLAGALNLPTPPAAMQPAPTTSSK